MTGRAATSSVGLWARPHDPHLWTSAPWGWLSGVGSIKPSRPDLPEQNTHDRKGRMLRATPAPDPHPSLPSCPGRRLEMEPQGEGREGGLPGCRQKQAPPVRTPWASVAAGQAASPGRGAPDRPSSPAGVSCAERTTRAPSGPRLGPAQDLLKVKPGLSKSRPGARISNPVCTKSQFPTLSQIHGRLAATRGEGGPELSEGGAWLSEQSGYLDMEGKHALAWLGRWAQNGDSRDSITHLK